MQIKNMFEKQIDRDIKALLKWVSRMKKMYIRN